ncbi:MAG TPA: ATP-binding protein [Thermoanaerobaculia bacterium]|jgi:ATP-dependent DNA helicase RecG|nr:ATP-binding protein [Thermoanaerobaculia bacterium]
MPLPINLDSLLHGKAVEWERLELKEGWNPLAVLHAICGFANDFHNLGGGYIIVGVEEKDGRPLLPPKGIAESRFDAIQKEILELGNSSIRPSYHPVVVPHETDGKARHRHPEDPPRHDGQRLARPRIRDR